MYATAPDAAAVLPVQHVQGSSTKSLGCSSSYWLCWEFPRVCMASHANVCIPPVGWAFALWSVSILTLVCAVDNQDASWPFRSCKTAMFASCVLLYVCGSAATAAVLMVSVS
jgi:hypothetical protein